MLISRTRVIIPNQHEPVVLIFGLADCERLSNKYPKKDKIFMEFEVISEESGHFHHGDRYLLTFHIILGLLTTIAFIPFIPKFIKEMKKDNVEVNWAFLTVNTCVFMKIIGFVFEGIDLILISNSGSGSDLLNFLGQASRFLSQYLFGCLLVFLAGGWTMNNTDIDDFEFFAPIAFIIGFVKFVIIGLSRTTSGDHDIFHRYDGWVGFLLCIFQIVMFGYFIGCSTELYMNATHLRIKRFSKYLLIFGTIYFLTFPVILLCTLWIEPHQKNMFVESSRGISEFIAVYFMAYITTNKRGIYKNIAKFNIEFPF